MLVYTHITHSRQWCNLYVMFGLNDRRILIQYPLYPNWSAKGFGKAILLLIALIARWLKILDTGIRSFCFDELCQLAYMIYITNANAGINILSITASCRDFRLFVVHNS